MNFSIRTVATVGAAVFVLAASSVPAAADAPFDQVVVAGNAGWVATGIEAQTGDTFNIRADGQVITFFPPRGGSHSGPDGQAGTCTSANGFVCAVEDAPWGALIGRFGDGEPFVIGARESKVTANESGELLLAVNDYVGTWFDNTGGYVVKVQ